jgi:hypothetical protein
MMEAAFILSLLLHRDLDLVWAVYEAGGVDAVAVVECESEFNWKAVRRESEGTSWGLFQLYDKYHKQYRNDLYQHIVTGAQFLEECKEKAGGDFVAAVSLYNSGSLTKSRKWGERVRRERDRLEWWLLRRMR